MNYHCHRNWLKAFGIGIGIIFAGVLIAAWFSGCCTHVDFRVGFGTLIAKNTEGLGPAEFRARVKEIIELGDLAAAEVRYIWKGQDGSRELQVLPIGIQDLSWDARVESGWQIAEAWIILNR
jgi:hypothetical protein